MQTEMLKEIILESIRDMKGLDINVLDVQNLTTITDCMIVVNGTSGRHVKAMADAVAEKCKKKGQKPMGQEGAVGSSWILLDMGSVLVHFMTSEAREFYDLEGLWSPSAGRQQEAK